MLNRLARSVHSVGGAVERTDVVARLLDVHLARRDPSTDDDPGLGRDLRAVVGAAVMPDTDLSPSATLDALALDRHEPASIAAAVAVARDDARRARDVVSTELWDCLNTTRSRLPRKVVGEKAHEFLGWVRERSALAVGVVDGAVSRDGVWEFFTLGRSLTRLTVTARMLASDLLDPGSATSWSTALRACGAGEAFHREFRHGSTTADAATFLLLDEHSPRSLLFLARRSEGCLDDLVGVHLAAEVRAFGEARAELETVTPETAVDAARSAGSRLAAAAMTITAALDRRVFTAPEPTH
ncbi:alpha-E domain-containing protein [Curtobacterium sp. MCBD17_030]|uniref:alpha-E domain-containing protein n=1 Tax=Curtobacterium sp. MCBD17_030 TaxID=2175649 RepID=UPI000D97B6E7|nr:alpha-E domain-containing protein [Curtobacterium sp. MCBD17_030]PYY33199.1 alpha-E domain-containing protein [Curtobacterium sp. MCBD17_030]